VTEAAAQSSPSPHASERRIVALGVVLTTIVLAYFYAANHSLFSTRRMTPIFQYLLMVEDAKTAWLTLRGLHRGGVLENIPCRFSKLSISLART